MRVHRATHISSVPLITPVPPGMCLRRRCNPCVCRGHADGARQKDPTPNCVLIFGLRLQKEVQADNSQDPKHSNSVPAPANTSPLYGLLASAMPSPSESPERFICSASSHGRWGTEALAAANYAARADDPSGEPDSPTDPNLVHL